MADLFNNIPYLSADDDYLIGIKDYYVDSLMWINAYNEVGIYKKLQTINDAYNLRLDNGSHQNRLKKLLGGNRSKNLLSQLPDGLVEYVGNTLTIE